MRTGEGLAGVLVLRTVGVGKRTVALRFGAALVAGGDAVPRTGRSGGCIPI